MDLNKQFSKNDPMADKGRWFEEGDARFLIASAKSKKYKVALEKAMERHRDVFRRSQRRNAKDDAIERAIEMRNEITNQCMAKHIILDWENVTEGKKVVPFSQENALRLLTDYPDFGVVIADMALADHSDNEESDADGVEQAKKS